MCPWIIGVCIFVILPIAIGCWINKCGKDEALDPKIDSIHNPGDHHEHQ